MIYLEDLLRTAPSTGARVAGQPRGRVFDGFAYDSRKIRPGELFIAIRTAKADGHDYLEHACKRGAAGVLVESEVDLSRFGATVVVVRDTRQTLAAWARLVLERLGPTVIGIAGSVGKSSVQKAVVEVLSRGYAGAPTVFDSDGFKTPLGLPISLGGLLPSHQVAVLELSGDGLSRLTEAAEIARPSICVVTNADADALGYPIFPHSPAGELGAAVSMLPADGRAVLNFDDPASRALAAWSSAPITTYSATGDMSADIWGESVTVDTDGTSFILAAGDQRQLVRVGLLGRHSVETALAAAGVGLARGLALAEIAAGLEAVRPRPGRLSPLPGQSGSLILDDSLGTSRRSLIAALAALRELPARRRLAVLGDVLSEQAEENDAALAGEIARSVDLLIIKGSSGLRLAGLVASHGLAREAIVLTDTAADAAERARAGGLGEGDIVLVKGAEDNRLEHVVQRLLASPETAPSVLVRQDEGWKQRVFLSRERPTWVEIDLGAIGYNISRVKQIVGPSVEVLAVLKADAYGHGALRVARTALLHGASRIATACLSEAVELRERGITAPILILGYTPPWQAAEIVRNDVTATVFSREVALHLSRAALAQGKRAPIHVKVDTGMGRIGIFPAEAANFIEDIRALPGIEVEGVFTHFAAADSADQGYALAQLSAFRGVLEELARRGISIRFAHAANSAAILSLPAAHLSMVRLGIAMHGLDPSPDVCCPADFRRALAFKTMIAQVKDFSVGSCISYGCRFVTDRPSRIAVIPVGYGDGFRRSPHNWGEVLVRGRRAALVGSVCMDMSMIDVTDVPGARTGDEVILIGRQGDEVITAESVAERLGTMNYEVVTQILARVPREVSPIEQL